jgi:hypothetical protein
MVHESIGNTKKLKGGMRLGFCRSSLYNVDTKETVKLHDIPVVLPAARNKSQKYDSSQHEIHVDIYHVLHIVPPIVIQNDTHAVNETSVHEQVETEDKEVSADK